jgi:hypothetical protein
MIGLLVLFMLALWLAAAIWIARRVARLIPVRPKWRPLVAIGLFLLVFFLPVADELAARPSFEAWCRKDAVFRVNTAKIRGATVRMSVPISNAPVKGAIIPTFHSRLVYADISSGEVLAQYDTYAALGGILVRSIGFPPTHSLAGSFYCAPDDLQSVKEKYGFVVVD